MHDSYLRSFLRVVTYEMTMIRSISLHRVRHICFREESNCVSIIVSGLARRYATTEGYKLNGVGDRMWFNEDWRGESADNDTGDTAQWNRFDFVFFRWTHYNLFLSLLQPVFHLSIPLFGSDLPPEVCTAMCCCWRWCDHADDDSPDERPQSFLYRHGSSPHANGIVIPLRMVRLLADIMGSGYVFDHSLGPICATLLEDFPNGTGSHQGAVLGETGTWRSARCMYPSPGGLRAQVVGEEVMTEGCSPITDEYFEQCWLDGGDMGMTEQDLSTPPFRGDVRLD
jgi:hypothetical protein